MCVHCYIYNSKASIFLFEHADPIDASQYGDNLQDKNINLPTTTINDADYSNSKLTLLYTHVYIFILHLISNIFTDCFLDTNKLNLPMVTAGEIMEITEGIYNYNYNTYKLFLITYIFYH